MDPIMYAELNKLAKKFTAEGKLIEAGWVGLRMAAVDPRAGQLQLEEMRNAFFAGAQHLFGSIVSMMDPGEEPTEADLIRMDQIQAELETFIEDFKRRHGLLPRGQR